jgi:uncharacterized membrane protein YobD (UPF0266 family)
MLLFACCSCVHDSLAFIYLLNVIITLTSIQEAVCCVIWLLSFRSLVTLHHFFIHVSLVCWLLNYRKQEVC